MPPRDKKKKHPAPPAATGKNGKNGQPLTQTQRSAKAAPAAPPPVKAQLAAFERGVALLHKRNYREARDLFDRATQGPNREIASKAAVHIRICESRLSAPLPQPKTPEAHYNYAIALINLRNLDPARRHLAAALEMEPRADHVHYALAVCLALSGDASGAYDSLKRAIEIQPRNRMVAREDSDFDVVANQPRFIRLLYPERDS
jgi:tetratricopeptide (TPR) repeat protein